MSPETEQLRATIGQVLRGLGFTPEFEAYSAPDAKGVDPQKGGVKISLLTWPKKRLRVVAVYPTSRDGRTHDRMPDNVEAGFAIDKPAPQLINEIRRRVLDPMKKNLPAILTRIAEHEAFLDRYAAANEVLESALLQFRRNESHRNNALYTLREGIDHRGGLSVFLSNYPEKSGPRCSIEITGLEAHHIKYLLEVYRNF